MRKLAIAFVVLCSCATACNRTDTAAPDMWPRQVEPRLTGAQWRPCSGVECGHRVAETHQPCPDMLESHAKALQALTDRPECTDNAITALRRFSAWNDVAAGYYLRAHREDRTSDLLDALHFAERAVATTPRDPAALFNLALIRESVGLQAPAVEAWSSAVDLDQSSWREEAQQRMARLRRRDAAARWQHGAALSDRKTLLLLVEEFPGPALEYYQQNPANRALAAALTQRLGYDVTAHYNKSIDSARSLAIEERTDEALAVLGELQRETEKHPSAHLRAQIRNMRAYALEKRSQYLEALAEYDVAYETFARLRDIEKTISIHRSKAGIYRTIGQLELAWRESLAGARQLHGVVDPRRRYTVLNEAALTALALGHPEAAMHYNDIAVTLLSRERDDRLLASARRTRAEIALQLGQDDLARRELAEALRLTNGRLQGGETLRNGLRVRIHQVRGQSVLRVDPQAAISAFTEALNALPPDELKTLRAELYAQRAEATALAGGSGEPDLEAALRELRQEEARLLQTRERTSGEPYWSIYFSRFEETYDRLVAQLANSGQWEKAFDYDERSRAYEPIDLILRRGVAPPAFRHLVPRGEPMSLAAIRGALPVGTVLLQYSVLDDHTYTWVIHNGGARIIRQSAKRRDVDRWSGTLQRAVRSRDANTFYRTSKAVYDGLFAEPLRNIRKPDRIVIVPDGAMHGMPFAALHDSLAQEYLIERAPIAIAGSATLYLFSKLRDEDLSSNGVQAALLVGDPTFNPIGVARGFDPLPHARVEVVNIGDLYRPLMDVDVRIGTEATVETFLALARDRTIIHFAGHAIVNPQQPWHSVLLLAQSGEHTGAIEAQELVRRLTLDRTRLVVLAACTSAGGLPLGPEGVSPLVRPLVAAGVPAVVGSLWDVEDATAGVLSVSFHRHYGQGSDAAKALQAAQIEMLRNGRQRLHSVFAWAPFQVIGHASSPFGSTQKRVNGGTDSGIHSSRTFFRDDGIHPQQ